MSEEKELIVVHNGSRRTIRTSKGILPIGGSLSLDPEEAKGLFDYPGVRDASKIAPQTRETIDGLKAKVQALTSENEDLKNQVKNLTNTTGQEQPVDEDVVKEKESSKKEKAHSGRR